MTLLFQHTSDANTARAFASLKDTFPSWEEVAAARVEEVADAIRSGGLADQKAPRIKAILAEVAEREGAYDLGRLESMDDAEAERYLCSLPGVGPKTAACVLLFSLGRAAFPVDTHVHRIALRLGLVDAGATAEETARRLGPKVPPELRYELHMQLIRHGREVCRARAPHCSGCVLFDLCPTGARLPASDGAV